MELICKTLHNEDFDDVSMLTKLCHTCKISQFIEKKQIYWSHMALYSNIAGVVGVTNKGQSLVKGRRFLGKKRFKM